MRNPNGWFIRLLFWLSDILKAHPPMGEAWCIKCCKNDGKTKVLSVTGLNQHLSSHDNHDYVQIITEERGEYS